MADSMPPEEELHFAILQRKGDEVRKLVTDAKVDLNKEYVLLSNSRPQRALVDAICAGPEMTRLLVELGANPMLDVTMGMNAPLFALFTAAAAPPSASCHCGHDAEDPDSVAGKEPNIALASLKVLIEDGKVDVAHRYQTRGGETKRLLDFAVASNQPDLIAYLTAATASE